MKLNKKLFGVLAIPIVAGVAGVTLLATNQAHAQTSSAVSSATDAFDVNEGPEVPDAQEKDANGQPAPADTETND